MVFVIRCVPDIFTDERINIGVCAIDANGNREAKVITEPGRLQCLYGQAASNVVLLAQAALHAANTGVQSPSPQVIFDVPRPYYNSTLSEVVSNTFSDQVTVALPHRLQPEIEKKTDEDVLTEVSNIIKVKQGLDFELLANTPQVIINTDKGPHVMSIPFQPAHGVGTVRSADCGPATLRTHLMDSILDLDCAARYRAKRHLGLFILRPKKGSTQEQAALNKAIDNVAFRSPPNLHLKVSDDVEDLADLATKWGRASS